MNLQKTSYQSLQFSQPDITDHENTRSCKKIRIYPSDEQIVLFNKCIGANRYFYNQANHFIKEKYKKALEIAKQDRKKRIDAKTGCVFLFKKGDKKGTQCCQSKVNEECFCKKHSKETKLNIDYSYLFRSVIRDEIITPDSELIVDNLWQKEVPYDTRQLAIDQVIAAYASNFELIKSRENKQFEVSFKSKKTASETFQINKKAINFQKLQIFSSRTKKEIQSSQTRSQEVTRWNRWNCDMLKNQTWKMVFMSSPRKIKKV
jgi:hypothetical protein